MSERSASTAARSGPATDAACGGRGEALPAWSRAALLLLPPLAAGLWALALGKDFSWDFRNYHFYNAHAFLTGRSAVDIAPAQLQSYYNPILDLPMYTLVQSVPARWVGFGMGAVQGLNFSLVFLLFLRVSRIPGSAATLLAAGATSLLACIAPASIIELGTGTGDNLVSLFVLAGLLAAVTAFPRSAGGELGVSRWRIALAGLAVGLAVGLKQTAIAFALGSALALLCVVRPWRLSLSCVMWFGFAGLAGVLLPSGHWLWAMWRETGNPLFPYFNHVFRSPAIAASSFVNEQFLPREVWDYLAWPLLFAANSHRVSYYRFTDLRFAALYLALLALAVRWVFVRWTARKQAPVGELRAPGGAAPGACFDRDRGNLLIAFLVCSFAAWMLLFSLYRYLLPLELLAPLCFALVLDRFGLARWPVRAVGVASAVAVLGFFSLDVPERTLWTSRYLTLDRAGFDPPPHSLVVMLGWHPMAYVIPQLPADLAYVRPGGNLRLTPRHGLYRAIEARIRDAEAGLYVMHGGSDRPADMLARARELGLGYDPRQCVRLRLDPPDNIRVCRAERLGD